MNSVNTKGENIRNPLSPCSSPSSSRPMKKSPGRPYKNDDSDLSLSCRWQGEECSADLVFASPKEARDHELLCHVRNNLGDNVCLIAGCTCNELKSFESVDKLESHFNKVHAWKHLTCEHCPGVRHSDQNKLTRHLDSIKCKNNRLANVKCLGSGSESENKASEMKKPCRKRHAPSSSSSEDVDENK